ncbi:MAG: hypothetical protein V6S10_08860 [Candidatus Methanoglobus sp.]
MQKEVRICDMNIALTRGMGLGSLAFEPAYEGNAGSSRLQSWSSSPLE